MDSPDRAISPFQAQDLLNNAGVNIGYIDLNILEQIMGKMKSDIEGMGSQGFTRRAMSNKISPEYIWAHTTAPGIIWLWAQQDQDTRASWLITQKDSWEYFNFKEPSPDAPLYGFTPSVSTSPSASRASDSAAGIGAVSIPRAAAAAPFSFANSFGPSSGSIPPNSYPFGSSSGSIPPTAANPFSLAPNSGPVSVPTTPTSQPSPTSQPRGGYRKRKTRKTRRKSSRRGRSRSRSRSRHIQRKKTHHRRHRR